jgi:hypothetical protein
MPVTVISTIKQQNRSETIGTPDFFLLLDSSDINFRVQGIQEDNTLDPGTTADYRYIVKDVSNMHPGFTGNTGDWGNNDIVYYIPPLAGELGYYEILLDASSNKQSGTIVFNEGDSKFYGFDGTDWLELGAGAIGVTGATGSQGFQGFQGNIGITGVQGFQGFQGLIGITGVQGFQGFQGNIGITGTQGFQGNIGITGVQGFQGFQGNIGITGVQGFQGFQGAKGSGKYFYGPTAPESTDDGLTLGSKWFNTTVGAEFTYIVEGDSTTQWVMVNVFSATGPQGPLGGGTGNQGFQGFQGPPGSGEGSGATGVQGFQGFQGNIGATGTQGFQGFQGLIGITGAQGFQGFQGNIGITGTQGFQGFQGNIGITGTQGFQGFQGNIGVTGVQGFQGFQGLIGITGVQGFQGFQGNIGINGENGKDGSTGPQGFQGFQGNIGITGVQGFQGFQGSIGITGAQGFQGFQGNIGITGVQGFQGFQGFQGSKGSGKYFYGPTAPESTDDGLTLGSKWFNTTVGAEFTYIVEGDDTTQWVMVNVFSATGPQGPLGGGTGNQGFQGLKGSTGDGFFDTTYDTGTEKSNTINYSTLGTVSGSARKIPVLLDNGSITFDYMRTSDLVPLFTISSFKFDNASTSKDYLIGSGTFSVANKNVNFTYVPPSETITNSVVNLVTILSNFGFPFDMGGATNANFSGESGISYPNGFLPNGITTATISLSVTASDGSNKTSNFNIQFKQNNYYGVTSSSSVDGEDLDLFTGYLDNNFVTNFTVSAGAGQFIYFAHPTRYGDDAVFQFGTNVVDFERVDGGNGSTHTNANGYVEKYYIYKSNQSNLGSGVNITVS